MDLEACHYNTEESALFHKREKYIYQKLYKKGYSTVRLDPLHKLNNGLQIIRLYGLKCT